jgi:hypothetical protein
MQSILEHQADDFWELAKKRILALHGKGMFATLQKDLTSKLDEIEVRLHKNCESPQGKPEDCDRIKQLQRDVVSAFKDQVIELLKDDGIFTKKMLNNKANTEALQLHQKLKHCGQLQEQSASSQAAEVQVPNKAEHASRLRVQKLQDEVRYEEKQIADQKEKAAEDKRHISHAVEEMQIDLKQRKEEIRLHQRKIAKAKRALATEKWAQLQRGALLHGDPLPPPQAADYSGSTGASKHPASHSGGKSESPSSDKHISDMPNIGVDLMPPPATVPHSVMDETIGQIFEEDFKHGGASHGDALLQMSAETTKGSKKAKAASAKVEKKGALASFKLSLNEHSKPVATKVQKTAKQIVEKIAHGHPKAKAAIATANALEAVNNDVRAASKKAAEAAAVQAVKLGLDVADTQDFVRKAARKAADQAAKHARAVFQESLKKQPTPQMLATKRIKLGDKELKKKKKEEQIRRKHWKKQDKASTKAVIVSTLHNKSLKKLTKAAVKSNPVANKLSSAKGQMKAAETKAVAAEAAAWKADVGGADTDVDVLKKIRAYQNAHKGISLSKAAQKWEEGEVLKMKKRFARHYVEGLKVDPNTKKGKLEALHQADRQKINAEKMVLQNAELRALVSKNNAEKSAKAAERMKDAVHREQLAATQKVKQQVSRIRSADSHAQSVQKQAIEKMLAKDASQTLKAKTEANAAKAKAKQSEAAKKEALAALSVARQKLRSLSKAAAKGTAILGVKLKNELRAQQEQVAQKLKKVKEATSQEVESRTKKAQAVLFKKKLEKMKSKLKQEAEDQSDKAEKRASNVVHAAEKAAAAANAMAQKEAHVAENAEQKSKRIAEAAEARARASKAALAAQIARDSKQKNLAIKHFKEFTASLKELETEKSAKAEKKIQQKQHEVEVATQAAAKVARFAEQQMTEADLRASEAAMNKVSAAGATLQNAIDTVKTVDARSRGHASIAAEQEALVDERAEKEKTKLAAVQKAKEKKVKKNLAAKENTSKALQAAKENKKKSVAKESKEKHDTISKEGYSKGYQKAIDLAKRQALEQAKVQQQQLAAEKAQGVEKQAKAIQKVEQTPQTPLQQETRRLVGQAVSKTKASGGEIAGAAVKDAASALSRYMHTHPDGSKSITHAKLGVETAAAAGGSLGATSAKKALHQAMAHTQVPVVSPGHAHTEAVAVPPMGDVKTNIKGVLNNAVRHVRNAPDSHNAASEQVKKAIAVLSHSPTNGA